MIEVFQGITVGPNVCGGKPCIRGLRFPVSRVLGLLAPGETKESILAAFPYLTTGDIEAAQKYAAFVAEHNRDAEESVGRRLKTCRS